MVHKAPIQATMSVIHFVQRQTRLRSGSPKSRKVWSLFYLYPGEFEITGNTVHLKLASIEIDLERDFFFLPKYELLRALILDNGALISRKDQAFYITIDSLRLNIQTAEDIFIIHEIFHEGCYNVSIPSGRYVAIDIGMNVGITSLYFASMAHVEKIYAFEPFGKTLQQAKNNIGLNGALGNKIETFNYGLSDAHKTIDVSYNYDEKGKMGVLGAERAGHIDDTTRESIELRHALPEINAICSRHGSLPVVVKIDCEGSEYEILKDCGEAGLPDNVKVVAIEWHEKGHEELKQRLSSWGFSTFVATPGNKQVGMLYAFR